MIVVVRKQHEGWWVGNCDGSTGVFPSNYVEAVDKHGAVRKNSKTAPSPVSSSSHSDTPCKASDKLVNLSSSTDRLALHDDDSDASQQPHQMGFSYLPRMEPGTSLSSILRTNTKKPAQQRSVDDVDDDQGASKGQVTKQCDDCGCTDFTANVFKPKSCNNCFHIH